jgi:plasmid replication initiation protein
MEKKEIVVKDYKLINARYRLSTVQMKIILKVLSLIHNKNDTEFETYSLPLSFFEFLTNSKHHQRVKDECDNLLSKVLMINTEDGWLKIHWFSSFEYKRSLNIIEATIDPKLKPYLLQLKSKFKPYEIKYIMEMDSEYAIRIYELCKQYEHTFTRKRKFELQELHQLMQVPKTYTKRYPDFRVNVLDVAVKEINKFSDIKISYEAIKRGKPVYWIEFTIEKNEKNIIQVEALRNQVFYSEIEHKEFKVMFAKFGFDLDSFQNEFEMFCRYNNDIKDRINITNFKKWCMQKKRKLSKQESIPSEQKEYKWQFKKAKEVSDKLKDWLEFDLGIDWLDDHYWKDEPIDGIGWQKVPHPDFNKDEILLYKLDDNSEETKYLIANKPN